MNKVLVFPHKQALAKVKVMVRVIYVSPPRDSFWRATEEGRLQGQSDRRLQVRLVILTLAEIIIYRTHALLPMPVARVRHTTNRKEQQIFFLLSRQSTSFLPYLMHPR